MDGWLDRLKIVGKMFMALINGIEWKLNSQNLRHKCGILFGYPKTNHWIIWQLPNDIKKSIEKLLPKPKMRRQIFNSLRLIKNEKEDKR
ncbi:hypothetical protein BLOT_000272 [Blomia tropicalis]|nr:hypothetical protein BLOT_000272 [Blomia tropicalis]